MTQAAPSHYDVLGVARDATPEQIKAAWRKASSAAHPDREGGSNEKMAAVNRAYEVLGDAERRRIYDETGSSITPNTIEQEAFAALAHCFQQALQRNAPNPIVFARNDFIEGQKAMKDEIAKARQFIERLKKQRGLVRVKKDGARNLLHDLIDGQLQNLERTIAGNQRLQEVAKAALKMLDDYEFTGPQQHAAERRYDLYNVHLDAEIARMFGRT